MLLETDWTSAYRAIGRSVGGRIEGTAKVVLDRDQAGVLAMVQGMSYSTNVEPE